MSALLPPIATTREQLSESLSAPRRAGKSVGLVPTMGALHAGHVSLVEAARRECDFVVTTIFVNPAQFGPHEDFSRYPRDLEADLSLLGPAGADLVFAPATADVYRAGHATFVEVGGVAEPLEGVFRPGHFRGVATVMLKLFNLIPADAAFFGRKDFQQALVIQQMVADLDLPVRVRVCPIVREADGLALSSRNAYLSADERKRALSLSRSLRLARKLVAAGERQAAIVKERMLAELNASGVTDIDYVAIANPQTLAEDTETGHPSVALIAARVGKTRLIDNELLG